MNTLGSKHQSEAGPDVKAASGAATGIAARGNVDNARQERLMMRTAMHTDQGRRDNLEDTARVITIGATLPMAVAATILVVLDGVGGEAGGEVASALGAADVITALLAYFNGRCVPGDSGPVQPDGLLQALHDALFGANQLVLARAEEDDRLSNMSTTVVCAVLVDDLLVLAWAGDSRCYLFSNGRLCRLTRDHSQVQELLDLGLVGLDEAKSHPAAHTITRYLGQPENFQPDARVYPLRQDDLLLLCTDGLTDVLSDIDIQTRIEAYRRGACSFGDLPVLLVNEALRAGTTDNVTVLCCERSPAPLGMGGNGLRTQTGDYPAAVARVLRTHAKETKDENGHTAHCHALA